MSPNTLLFLVAWLACAPLAFAEEPLWLHLQGKSPFGELRGVTANWQAGALQLNALPRSAGQAEALHGSYAWAVLPAPAAGWDLTRRNSVEAEITNRGDQQVNVILWVVGDNGWGAVPDAARIAPNEARRFSCSLRETYPDGTPKIDPARISHVQVMITGRVAAPLRLEVRGLAAVGEAPLWRRPAARLDVPRVVAARPAPGLRVRYRLASDTDTGIYSVVYLPPDWRPDGTYPVIVEYPGNIFFVPGCYSTGLPEQCIIGYGMTKGAGAICLGLPFIDRSAGVIVENGWGDADETAEYAVRMIDEVCERFGGERDNLVLTGFSRGAIACGYIGLRNDRIAALWKGFHACQHYDGDGWRGATMDGALERARRFRGRAVFQTDNSREAFQPLMEAMQADVTWAQSGLDAHSTAMFLDDRPATRQLRAWFAELVEK